MKNFFFIVLSIMTPPTSKNDVARTKNFIDCYRTNIMNEQHKNVHTKLCDQEKSILLKPGACVYKLLKENPFKPFELSL